MKYLVTYLQDNKTVWLEISVEHCQIERAHWLVAEEGRLIVIREQGNIFVSIYSLPILFDILSNYTL